jgi:hypothetical protein
MIFMAVQTKIACARQANFSAFGGKVNTNKNAALQF